MARLFVDNLTVIDCSRLDPERGLIGESWIVDVELAGSLDEQGMVCDFSLVKQCIKRVVDETVDHRLLVAADSALVEGRNGAVAVRQETGRGVVFMEAPAVAVAVLPGARTDERAVETHLQERIRPELPANVVDLRLTLRCEPVRGATFRYSHGLERHDGACQRIAHGHRSALRIQRNGAPAGDWEAYWAERWHDIYLASRYHRVDEMTRGDAVYWRFAYEGSEGHYTLELPAVCCEVLETETTVEQIASHMLAVMQAREPGAAFRVCAYEGVGKGAVAET